jgi:S1-C subfamily serine protease
LNLPPGTFVFTTEGLFAGVAVQNGGAPSLVPGQLVLAAAEELTQEIPRVPGQVGISVQSTALGLAVAWVDPAGPAADELSATDIIEAVNGRAVATAEEWRAHARHFASGDEVKLRVRSEGETRDVSIVAAAVVEPPENPSLGLRMRAAAGGGVDVLEVEPRSRGDRAGIRPGDRVTVFGSQKAPTPAQVTRAFDTLPLGDRVLAAIARGDGHQVVVVEKNVRPKADAPEADAGQNR